MVVSVTRDRPAAVAATHRQAQEVDQWHPIVASNRGPVEYTLSHECMLIPKRTGGGLVSAISALDRHIDFTWVAAAMSEGDRRVAAEGWREPGANPRLRFVVLPPDTYHHHYHSFSNPVLWFLQHSLWSQLSAESIGTALTTGWVAGYLPANATFATVIAAEARRRGSRPVVMLQDYHLYLVAPYLRRMLREAVLQHFVHIPWPAPDRWLVLPPAVRDALFRGLLANDIVGFQTRRDARHFLQGCAHFLAEAVVDVENGHVFASGRQTLVRAYPISVDTADMNASLAAPAVAAHRRRLSALCGQRTIVRVDRLDPSKGVLEGFRAFERLLAESPKWVGTVRFLAFLVPSRTTIPEYRRYAEEVFALVAEINTRYECDGYQPIEVFYEDDRAQALAGLKLYDVLLVNSLADGMNLVAKEGPLANERDGVLVLSGGAGAHEQLGAGALSVKGDRVDEMAAVLARALAMPVDERKARAALLRRAVTTADLELWLASQLDDIRPLAEPPAHLTSQGSSRVPAA